MGVLMHINTLTIRLINNTMNNWKHNAKLIILVQQSFILIQKLRRIKCTLKQGNEAQDLIELNFRISSLLMNFLIASFVSHLACAYFYTQKNI